MDTSLAVALARHGGVASARDLVSIGLTPNDLRGLLRRGELVRARHGSYIDGPRFSSSSAAERHRLAARAVAFHLPGYAVSHLSAVTLWGLPTLESDLGPVHLSGVGRGRARNGRGVRFHAAVPAEVITGRDGVQVVQPALAVVQTATISGQRAGLVAADAGLRARLFDHSQLLEHALVQARPKAARRVAGLASSASESPGESWCRLVFADLGMNQPRQQVDIRDEHDRFVARVDFLFDELRLIVEFDGEVKYGGASGRQALVDEKRREDALRRLGYRVVRLTWRDLADPHRVVQLLS